jgi:3-oxoacyl-[acyl-carrier-protein] synthase II
MTRRIVVTGLGMVTPLGHDVESTWSAIKNGQSGIARISQYDPSEHLVQIAAEVKNWDATQYVEAKELRRRDRYQLFSYAAAMQAWQQAGITLHTEEEHDRTSVIIGSSVGGMLSFEDQILLVERTHNLRKVSPFGIPMLVVNGASNMVSIAIGANGPTQTLASACATGVDCIGFAYHLIQSGQVDRALAGCGEAPILAIGIGVFDRMGATSRRNDDPTGSMRPFSKDREGLVFSEGAAVLMLEEYESAVKRGATILAEIVGYGCTSDAFHVTAPEPEGMGASKAIRSALKDAQLNTTDVDYISAHGTATPLNDPMETKAVKRVFGEQAYTIPMSSTKSMTGHGMGMTAALESAFCVLAIRDQVAPPTINLHTPDPDCDLDYVPNEARDVKINVAMNNAFGFGGHNSSLIFKKL